MGKMAERPHYAADYDPDYRCQQGPMADPAGKGGERLFARKVAGLGRLYVETGAVARG
jgi:hypothetical protein